MLGIGTSELILILVLALIIFGPGKLPEIGRAVGKGVAEFKRASQSIQEEISRSLEDDEPGEEMSTKPGAKPGEK